MSEHRKTPSVSGARLPAMPLPTNRLQSGTDGCPVLGEGRVQPDALTLPDDQPGPRLAVAVSGDNFRDGIEPCSIRLGVGGSRKHHRKIADVLARGPRCGPLVSTVVQLFKLDVPVRPVLPVGGWAEHETLPPGPDTPALHGKQQSVRRRLRWPQLSGSSYAVGPHPVAAFREERSPRGSVLGGPGSVCGPAVCRFCAPESGRLLGMMRVMTRPDFA
jgi:hypothetical protein